MGAWLDCLYTLSDPERDEYFKKIETTVPKDSKSACPSICKDWKDWLDKLRKDFNDYDERKNKFV